MSGYLLITELKRPAGVQAKLGVSLADVAIALVVPPDSVRLELRQSTDLSDDTTMDRVIRCIMQGVQECGEEAQMGFFTDSQSPPPA